MSITYTPEGDSLSPRVVGGVSAAIAVAAVLALVGESAWEGFKESYDSITPDNTIPPSAPQPTEPIIHSTPEIKPDSIKTETPIPTKELEDYSNPGFTPEVNEGITLYANSFVEDLKTDITDNLNDLQTGAPEIDFANPDANLNEFKVWLDSLDADSADDYVNAIDFYREISRDDGINGPNPLYADLDSLAQTYSDQAVKDELTKTSAHLREIHSKVVETLNDKYGTRLYTP